MATEREINDIPEENVDEVMQGFIDAGCDPVTKHKQENGQWTVKAICPDE